jgi:hypothetical protein
MRWTTLFAGALVALAAPACVPQGGTDVGNGAQVSLNLSAYEAPPAPAPQALPLGDGASISELWMVVDRLKLRPAADCTIETEDIEIEGPLVANLVDEGVLGGAASVTVPAGPYCRFRIGFEKLEGAIVGGAPAELAGLSLLMKGTRSDGTPFTVRSDASDDFELEARNGAFELAPGENPLFLAYDVAPWMTALALGSLPGGSPIVVDEDQNADRLDAFEDAVKASGRLFRDGDDDGALGEDEHEDGDELAD